MSRPRSSSVKASGIAVAVALVVAGCGTDVGATSSDSSVVEVAESATTATSAAERTTTTRPAANLIELASFDFEALEGKPTVLWFWAPG